MSAAVHVLVAFACQNGSTAGIAETIATELRAAGLEADCRPVAAVADLESYDAVVLGSGVFLVRRQSDGGGFIARHADELARRPVWLFSAGPIGGTDPSRNGDPMGDEPPVVRVAQAIGARGAAAFGTTRLHVAPHDGGLPLGDWRALERVRAWARAIAADLVGPGADDGAGVEGPAARDRWARAGRRQTGGPASGGSPTVVTR